MMNQGQGSTIYDKDGVLGIIENQAAPPAGATSAYWCVRLENGHRVIVPSEALEARPQVGYYYLPVSLASFAVSPAAEAARPQGYESEQRATAPMNFTSPTAVASPRGRELEERAAAPVSFIPPTDAERPQSYESEKRATAPMNLTPPTEAVAIPVIAEELFVDKREIEAGGVRLHKTVHERIATVDEPLSHEEVNVERVAVNRIVDAPVAVRQEGDTLIVPLLEEVLVVEKRLMLREELHVTRRRIVTRDPQQVTLRREEVTVERFTRSAEDERGSPVTERQPAPGTAS